MTSSRSTRPDEPLTRQELDLVDVPGGTLVLDRLLPADPVAVGESWKLTDRVLANLLCLDAVSWTDVRSTLGTVKDDIADIGTTGKVAGAVGGVSTEIEVKARYKFSLEQKRIVYFALLIKEKRAIGHIGPGLDTVAKVLVKISPISGSEKLTAEVIQTLSRSVPPEMTRLSFRSAGGEFGFLHDRRWFLTTEDPKLAVFRYLERGELIAQCNVSAVPTTQKKALTLAEFQRDIQTSLGKNFGQFVSARQSTNDHGHTIFRVVVHGTVSKLPIQWVYYLIGDSKGRRVSLAFTLEESLVDRFSEADRLLAASIQILDPKAMTVANPIERK